MTSTGFLFYSPGAAAGEAFAQLRDADLFTAEAPVPFGGSFGAAAAPAPPGLTAAEAAAWAAFPERNLGLVGWNFRRAAARGVALDFARAFARELQGGAAVRQSCSFDPMRSKVSR